MAVTRPVTYPSIMSSKKAKMLIACVWILSFLICFPPLVGWNDRKRKLFKQLVQQPNTTSSLILGTSSSIMPDLSFDQNQIYQQHQLPHEQQNQDLHFFTKEGLYRVQECSPTCELTNDKVIHHHHFVIIRKNFSSIEVSGLGVLDMSSTHHLEEMTMCPESPK